MYYTFPSFCSCSHACLSNILKNGKYTSVDTIVAPIWNAAICHPPQINPLIINGVPVGAPIPDTTSNIPAIVKLMRMVNDAKLIEKLEEDDDVQNVFHNMKEDESGEE